MPIIKDPRQNHKEKRFGIIEIDGVYCYYDKKKNGATSLELRSAPFGYVVEIEDITLSISNPSPPIIYNGQLVTVKAEFEVPSNSQQGPLVQHIYDALLKYPWSNKKSESELGTVD